MIGSIIHSCAISISVFIIHFLLIVCCLSEFPVLFIQHYRFFCIRCCKKRTTLILFRINAAQTVGFYQVSDFPVVLHIIRQSSDLLFVFYYIIRMENCQSGKFTCIIRMLVTQSLFFIFFNNCRLFPHVIFFSPRPHDTS